MLQWKPRLVLVLLAAAAVAQFLAAAKGHAPINHGWNHGW